MHKCAFIRNIRESTKVLDDGRIVIKRARVVSTDWRSQKSRQDYQVQIGLWWCSSQNGQISLNDVLEKGPCLMNSLLDVLISWKQSKMGTNWLQTLPSMSLIFMLIAPKSNFQKQEGFWRIILMWMTSLARRQHQRKLKNWSMVSMQFCASLPLKARLPSQ